MKKTFQLQVEGKHPDRLVEAIKNEIRKYILRERRRELPAGADFLDFDCRFGSAAEQAEAIHLSEVKARIDAVVREGGKQFYLEILARPAQRTARAPGQAGAGAPETEADGDGDGD
jgi:hypothetical protein